MKLRIIILTFSFLFSVAGFSIDKVVYGEDNRVDLYDTSPLYLEWARSTAAMISKRKLKETFKGNWEISGGTLKDRNICADESFTDQTAAASCSGFLVAPDVVVTAGHCIQRMSDCKNNSWIFGFGIQEHGSDEYQKVENENIYNCKAIIATKLENDSKNDFAVIQLDRPVLGRTPLKVRKKGKIKKGDRLVVIGHPTGLPTKVADGAKVRNAKDEVYFVTNLDTFGGNSGSAVFNEDTGLVEGILVRGESDYESHPSRGCQVVKQCTDYGCRGEDVTKITNIKELQDLLKRRGL
ncbi:MAG: serine protease [Epsilonproteobacteria bacterium]|nr:MAG: serine protease [Campylobacterota bacterium]RLA67191.1 MAG: serine protease [Campylobacterota bacterium]